MPYLHKITHNKCWRQTSSKHLRLGQKYFVAVVPTVFFFFFSQDLVSCLQFHAVGCKKWTEAHFNATAKLSFFFSCGITLYFHLQHTLYWGQHFYNYYVKNKHAAILQKFLLPCNFMQENIISWIFSLGRCKQQGTLFCTVICCI